MIKLIYSVLSALIITLSIFIWANDARATSLYAPNPPLPVSTFANLPSASSLPAGSRYFVSDLGMAGTTLTTNGSVWQTPIIDQYIDNNFYILAGIPASSTAAQSGTTTVTVTTSAAHNIPAATFNGGYVYYPGSTNITAGWYSNFQRTGTTTYTFTYTVSQTVSDSINGGSAYINTPTQIAFQTGANTLNVSKLVNIPAGALGKNGFAYIFGSVSAGTSANAKTIDCYIGSSQFSTNSVYFTGGSGSFNSMVYNAGSLSSQRTPGTVFGGAASASYFSGGTASGSVTNNFQTYSINTASASSLSCKLTVATASDYLVTTSLMFKLNPSY